MPDTPACRFCHHPLHHLMVDLGQSPLANSLIKPQAIHQPDLMYPLRVYVCEACYLVQLEAFEPPDVIFADYPYFSSYSSSWLTHAQQYAAMAVIRFQLTANSQVVELASNDGYLLQYVQQHGIPVLGVEPAANVARVAQKKGIPTDVAFFGTQTAQRLLQEGHAADVLIGNNVLAHVPDLNDFVAGMAQLLKPDGVILMEFPHVVRLIAENQFDTIYHEHFSYFSLTSVQRIFAHHGLQLVDVEAWPTHGGSLRIFATHAHSHRWLSEAGTHHVEALLQAEAAQGVQTLPYYTGLGKAVQQVKTALVEFLTQAQAEGKRVAGYGAPAKGNTLLNYCGIGPALLPFTVDKNPEKQGCLLPGVRIPVHAPATLRETRPDYVLILPWNLKAEIMADLADIESWGGQFVVPIPTLEVFSPHATN